MRELNWWIKMYKNRLKDLRINNKLLQKDLAKILNISEITYTHYESEYYIIPTKYLITLCNYFNVSLNYIFELEKEPKIIGKVVELRRKK